MYSTKNIDNIQNEKCDNCMFCVWNSERKKYVCDVKGCYENSKYIEFSWDKLKGQAGGSCDRFNFYYSSMHGSCNWVIDSTMDNSK